MSIVQVIDSLEKYLKENIPNLYLSSDSNDSDIYEFNVFNYNNLYNNIVDIKISGTLDSSSSNTVIGNGTVFLNDFIIGDSLKINGEVRKITDIESNTILYIDEDFYTVNNGDDIYKPSSSGFVILDNNNQLYQTDENLTGWNISYNGESISITSHDLLNSIINIESVFSDNIPELQNMVISKKSWGYIKIPNFSGNASSCNEFKNESSRVYFYIKTKDDSNKRSIYKIIDNVRKATRITNNFPIYSDDTFTDIIAYGRFNSDINFTEGFESDTDLQSYVADFQIQYYEKY